MLALLRALGPRIIMGLLGVAAVGSVWVHYRMVIGERNDLRTQNASFQQAVKLLGESLEQEAEAARTALAERQAAQSALERLRRDREADVSVQEWANTPLPASEIDRLCAALPEMKGCEVIPQ